MSYHIYQNLGHPGSRKEFLDPQGKPSNNREVVKHVLPLKRTKGLTMFQDKYIVLQDISGLSI